MVKKRKPKKDDPEQSRQFIETAQDLELDNDQQKFNDAMASILVKKPAKKKSE